MERKFLFNFRQTTIKKPIYLSGTALHSGLPASIELHPAPANTGIVFQTHDNKKKLSADIRFLYTTRLSTSLCTDNTVFSTIEHLLATLLGMAVTNITIRVKGGEIPIMDGSAKMFVYSIMKAGIKKLKPMQKYWKVEKTFQYFYEDKWILIEPHDRPTMEIHCMIDYQDIPVIGKQNYAMSLNLMEFLAISDSRTFCHLNDIENMHKNKLALGGSFDNAVVVTDNKVLNASGLRYHDEFVRHKTLDFIGDISLLGLPLIGKVTIYKPGHFLHTSCIKELFKHKKQFIRQIFSQELYRSVAKKLDFCYPVDTALVAYSD